MPPSFFPLRWESTGDQWWFASPIDWAAANGHYDLVRELLHLDTNLLFKLTSLRRIRRLETVWDDETQFNHVAKCRSQVARKLFVECESKRRSNSLIRAGYGGWLLYTAASAGDLGFVKELLDRDPLLVFGEGEFGVTDIFYAAARSRNPEVFRVLFDFAVSPRYLMGNGGEMEQQPEEVPEVFRWEIVNRAVHAAARGGNLEILRELLADCTDVLAYKDLQGSTILHAASGRGQVEVAKYLVASFDIIASTDNQGNTALHVAAYRGHLAVLEALILASPSSSSLRNNGGDTFLHMAVAGFHTPGFRRLDRQIELMKQLVCGKIISMRDVINIRNNDGRTVLHMAVLENIHSNLVELLMKIPSIDLNMRDVYGMTPLDLLRQGPKSVLSELLIKQLISAGGMSSCQDYMARSAIVSHLKMQGIESSPGTSFKICDAEILLHTGIESASDAVGDLESATCLSELSNFDSIDGSHGSFDNKRAGAVNNAARHLKILLQWSSRKQKKSESLKKLGDNDSVGSCKKRRNLDDTPTPLRQRFSKPSSLPNNKRTLSVRSNLPSPSSKKKFAVGVINGVVQAMPHVAVPTRSSTSSFSNSPIPSPTSLDKQKGLHIGNESADPSCSNQSLIGEPVEITQKRTPVKRRFMNQYFCFGAQSLAVHDPVMRPPSNKGYKRSLLSVA
ncbi:ankyrin-2-like [Macadamia integrifolia]|uniref:ankyrin-2-like n=1 Tax=Macadamia integrifolia TaxID=60698 RepID=UPI001C4E338D|nr:ankyrin-2-like [Macadamia integrifolia]